MDEQKANRRTKTYNSILVPIDISGADLTRQVIPYMRAHSVLNTAGIYLLTAVPALPYHSSSGLAYSAEMPKLGDFQHVALLKLGEIVKQFRIPAEGIQAHVVLGAPKDQIFNLAKTIGADLIIIASRHPDITTYLLGSNAAAVV